MSLDHEQCRSRSGRQDEWAGESRSRYSDYKRRDNERYQRNDGDNPSSRHKEWDEPTNHYRSSQDRGPREDAFESRRADDYGENERRPARRDDDADRERRSKSRRDRHGEEHGRSRRDRREREAWEEKPSRHKEADTGGWDNPPHDIDSYQNKDEPRDPLKRRDHDEYAAGYSNQRGASGAYRSNRGDYRDGAGGEYGDSHNGGGGGGYNGRSGGGYHGSYTGEDGGGGYTTGGGAGRYGGNYNGYNDRSGGGSGRGYNGGDGGGGYRGSGYNRKANSRGGYRGGYNGGGNRGGGYRGGYNRGGYNGGGYNGGGYNGGGYNGGGYNGGGYNDGGYNGGGYNGGGYNGGGYNGGGYNGGGYNGGGYNGGGYNGGGYNGGGYNGGGYNGGGYNRGGGSPSHYSEDLWGGNVTADEELHDLMKDCYNETQLVRDMSEEVVAEYRRSKNIVCDDDRCPRPIPDFDAAPFPENVVEWLKQKFAAPTAVQAQGWSIAMSGYNMITRATTGSGKTLGFGLPGLLHAKMQISAGVVPEELRVGPLILIVSPTRELSSQIYDELSHPAQLFGLKIALILGGDSHPVRANIDVLLNERPHVVVGVPGRLGHLLNNGTLNLSSTSFFVLDEADRMLDMGFSKDVSGLNRAIRPDRQVLLWSATWPRKVNDLANELFPAFRGLDAGTAARLRDRDNRIQTTDPYAVPIYLRIGKHETQIVDTLKYEFQWCNNNSEYDQLLIEHLRPLVDYRTVVFCNRKGDCDYLLEMINRELPEHRADTIHGDKLQNARERVMAEFREGLTNILIGTDVIGRGIDVRGLQEVVIYEMPRELESFVHRTGRTARAGCSGVAFSLVSHNDHEIMVAIGRMLRENKADMKSYNACFANFSGGDDAGHCVGEEQDINDCQYE